jgi:hypothetical protein
MGRSLSVSSSAFEPSDELVDVPRFEADGTAEMDCGELAALDEALDGSRMDVQKASSLVGRE